METSKLLTSVPSVKEVMSICSTDPETLTQSDGKNASELRGHISSYELQIIQLFPSEECEIYVF